MKTTITHAWERGDESLQFVRHAMHLLQNLQRPADEASLRPYRRVVEDGSSFTSRDVKTAASYIREMAGRAEKSANAHIAGGTEFGNVAAEGLRNAARAANDAANRLEAVFARAQLEESGNA